MRQVLPVLLCLATLSSVGAQTRQKHLRQIFPPDENPQYFPIGLFSGHAELSEWTARWYANALRGLSEPSLWKNIPKPGWTVFRFTVLASRGSNFILRLTVNPDGDATLLAKWMTKAEGTAAGHAQQQSVPVTHDQVKKFLELLNDADFWELSTAKTAYGYDGQEWLLEGRRNGEYHIVDRWNGVMEDAYYNACEYLYKLGQSSAN